MQDLFNASEDIAGMDYRADFKTHASRGGHSGHEGHGTHQMGGHDMSMTVRFFLRFFFISHLNSLKFRIDRYLKFGVSEINFIKTCSSCVYSMLLTVRIINITCWIFTLYC